MNPRVLCDADAKIGAFGVLFALAYVGTTVFDTVLTLVSAVARPG